jgi:hypothetical protein
MANAKHLAKLKTGVRTWNRWRERNPGLRPNLEGVGIYDLLAGKNRLLFGDDPRKSLASINFSFASLSGVDFSGIALTGADLRESFLLNARFINADLHRANLRGSHLVGADLRTADLRSAVPWGADLRAADLGAANLEGADLSHALAGGTNFGDIDFATTQGIETIEHSYASTVGIGTIFRSHGKIPESFLRGCGVPDEFITYAKSLTTNPIQFYSCFISYSTKDQDFADRLYADLQNKGVRCWFAPHDIQGGKKIHEQIDEAIRLHDKLLLILSPHSMESEWVKTEIAKARKRELRDPKGVLKRRVLFPIRLAPFETLRDWECFDADTGKDSAREIREYFIPDFSHWKNHDSYQEAFQSLIRDLKASDGKLK